MLVERKEKEQDNEKNTWRKGKKQGRNNEGRTGIRKRMKDIKEVLEITNSPTFLAFFNNTVSAALFNCSKLGLHGYITYHGYYG